ncbi:MULTISPECIES: HDOD domain-containing protein [Deferrisoma]
MTRPEDERPMTAPLADRVARLIDDLPRLPAVAQQALALLADPATEPEHLEAVLARDPSLSLRVLRLANSAYYRRSREVRTLSAAIVFLGFRTLHTLVLTSAVQRVLAGAGRLAEPLWLHSYGAGIACREWARRTRGGDPEEAFLAGLFHDVGKGVIALRFPRVYDEPAGVEGEAKALGFDHGELGRVLLERWELPGALAEAVGSHHADEPDGLGAVARLGDWVAWAAAPGVGAPEPEPPAGVADDEPLLAEIREAVAAAVAEEGTA